MNTLSGKTKKSIFVVDAGSHITRMTYRILGKLGYKVSCLSIQDIQVELSKNNCDLIILELSENFSNAINWIRQIRWSNTLLPVLVILKDRDLNMAFEVGNSGADAFVGTPFEQRKFIQAVKTVLHQVNDLDEEDVLTPREKEVLGLIGNGLSNKEIAHQLYITVRTVEYHRSHIMKNLGVENFADLVKKAICLGLTKLNGPNHPKLSISKFDGNV